MLSLLFAAAIAVSPSPMCTFLPFSGFRDSVTYLLGTAAADTMWAGRGKTEKGAHDANWSPGASREVYGQIVRVDRLGGADSAFVEDAFRKAGVREAVVVPWNFGPDCRPLLWGKSFRFVESVAPGMYTVQLRRGELVNGRPVLDAFMTVLDPYPHADFYQQGVRNAGTEGAGPPLTAAEYFDFYRALPHYALARKDPGKAAEMLNAVERSHAALVTRYPARNTLEQARRLVDAFKRTPTPPMEP